jgi:hypothetical protein
MRFGVVQPLEEAFFFSAQRFFIASERRFLPAAVIPPPRFLVAVVRDAVDDFALRAAQRAFIAAANRFLPAGVIPPRRLGEAALRVARFVTLDKPAPSSKALIARPIRSRSLLRSETILLRSK